MERARPFVKCIDYWPEKISPEKMEAYRQMIQEGQIRKHHVIYNRRTGSTTVEYYAIAPHEWILDQMRNIVEKQEKNHEKDTYTF